MLVEVWRDVSVPKMGIYRTLQGNYMWLCVYFACESLFVRSNAVPMFLVKLLVNWDEIEQRFSLDKDGFKTFLYPFLFTIFKYEKVTTFILKHSSFWEREKSVYRILEMV